jgi:alpha-L-fucosidase
MNNCTLAYRDYLHTQIRESIQRYEVDHVYLDDNAITNFMPHNRSSEWFASEELLAWIVNDSPVADRKQPDGKPRVVVNDRWGYAARSQHFNYHLCEDTKGTELGYGCSPGFNPLNTTPANRDDAWAWTFGLGKGFGYNRRENATDYKSAAFIISTLVRAISLGGNLEMSLGPTSDGRIDNLVQLRLLQLGSWLHVNGEAVYGSRRWRTPHGTDSTTTANVSYTYQRTDAAVFAIVQGWPSGGTLTLRDPVTTPDATQVSLVGRPDVGNLKWTPLRTSVSGGGRTAAGMAVTLPTLPPAALPSSFGFFVFKLVHVS